MNPGGDTREEFNLTSDAKRATDEFTGRIVSELLLRSRIYADARGSRTVERRDVYLASREFKLPAAPKTRGSALSWLRSVGYGLALSGSASLGATLVWAGLEQADELASIMGAVVALLGLLLALSAARKSRISRMESAVSRGDLQVGARADTWELVEVWKDIERLMHEDTPTWVERRGTLSALVDDFSQRHNLGEEFASSLRRVLRLRNQVVHGVGKPISEEELGKALRDAELLIEVAKRVTGHEQP